MQFKSLTLICVSMIAFASADLHYKAVCIDDMNGQDVYNPTATEKACEAYKARNTGTEQWDTCPDCKMVTTGEPPYCNSDGQHMGGKEITSYCTDNGADNALTS